MYASSGSKYYTYKGFSCQYKINRAYPSSKRKGVRRHNHFNAESGLPVLKWVWVEQDGQRVKTLQNYRGAKDTACFHGEQLDLLVTARLFGFQLLSMLPSFTHLTSGKNWKQLWKEAQLFLWGVSAVEWSTEITVGIPRPQALGDKSSQGITMPQPKRLRGCRKLGIRCTEGGHRVPGSLEWQRGKPSQHSQQEPAAEKKRKRKKISESQAVLFLFAKLILQLSP